MSSEKIYSTIKRIVLSEKTTRLIQLAQTHVFLVDPKSTKKDIKEAVESVFSVTVLSVRTLCASGKKKRVRGRMGTRVNTKKAYVKLAEGQTIDLDSTSLTPSK